MKDIEKALIFFVYTHGQYPRYFKYVSPGESYERIKGLKGLTIGGIHFDVDFFKWGNESDYCFLKPFLNESQTMAKMLLIGWSECTGRYIKELVKEFKNSRIQK